MQLRLNSENTWLSRQEMEIATSCLEKDSIVTLNNCSISLDKYRYVDAPSHRGFAFDIMEFTLTPSQVDAYLHRIGLPQKYFPSSIPPIDLAYITALHVHHITSIPYETSVYITPESIMSRSSRQCYTTR